MNVARNKNQKNLRSTGGNPCNEIILKSVNTCNLPPFVPTDYCGKHFRVGQFVVLCKKNKKFVHGNIIKIGRRMVTIGLRDGKVVTRKFDNVVIVY